MGDLPDAILYVAPFGSRLLGVRGIRGSVSTAQAHVAEVWLAGPTWVPPWAPRGLDGSPAPLPDRRALAVRWAGAWVLDGWDRAYRVLPGHGGRTVPVPTLEHARTMGSALVQAELATEVLEIHATLGPVAFEVATINRGAPALSEQDVALIVNKGRERSADAYRRGLAERAVAGSRGQSTTICPSNQISNASAPVEIARLESTVRARGIGACSVLNGASCLSWLQDGMCQHVPEAKWLRRRPGPGEAILMPGETTTK